MSKEFKVGDTIRILDTTLGGSYKPNELFRVGDICTIHYIDHGNDAWIKSTVEGARLNEVCIGTLEYLEDSVELLEPHLTKKDKLKLLEEAIPETHQVDVCPDGSIGYEILREYAAVNKENTKYLLLLLMKEALEKNVSLLDLLEDND